eukprot:1850509-Alexandrium_andersonii.AAC.1
MRPRLARGASARLKGIGARRWEGAGGTGSPMAGRAGRRARRATWTGLRVRKDREALDGANT